MEGTSWKDPGVIKEIAAYKNKTRYKIDADKYPQWIEKFKVGGLPTVMIVSAKDHKVINRVEGYQSADQLKSLLSKPTKVSAENGPSSKVKKSP